MVFKKDFVKLSHKGCSGHHTDIDEGDVAKSVSNEMRGACGEGLLSARAGQESCPREAALMHS